MLDIKSDYKKLKTTSTWPGKNNSYEVKLTNDKGDEYVNGYFPKEEYELIQVLKNIKDKISETDMSYLLKAIDDYSDHRYEKGCDDTREETEDL